MPSSLMGLLFTSHWLFHCLAVSLAVCWQPVKAHTNTHFLQPIVVTWALFSILTQLCTAFNFRCVFLFVDYGKGKFLNIYTTEQHSWDDLIPRYDATPQRLPHNKPMTAAHRHTPPHQHCDLTREEQVLFSTDYRPLCVFKGHGSGALTQVTCTPGLLLWG